MEKEKPFETLSVALCYDDVLREALAESSYVAASLVAVAPEPPHVAQLIITADEMPFVRRACAEAYAAIAPRLLAYAAAGGGVDGEGLRFALALPRGGRVDGLDALLLHELRRAVVSYVLYRWYAAKSAAPAADALRRYEASVGMALHDLRLARGHVRRGSTYF